MRVGTMSMIALAGAMVVGMTAGASAQRMDRNGGMMTMDRAGMRTQSMEIRTVREPRSTGTVTTSRGASYYAPGQVKKRMKVQSARQFAPGQQMMDDEPVMGGRMMRR